MMTLEEFSSRRAARLAAEKPPRAYCLSCRRPGVTCYCNTIRPFFSPVRFVILMHSYEARRSIATGRMAHRCLANSELIEGSDFTENGRVNAILGDTENYPVLLYPGVSAVNLSHLKPEERTALFPPNKRLVVFIVDGTWSQAKRMKRLSRNLHSIPQISFTPPRPSGFLVRKQPREECFSTIESAHHILELLGAIPGGPHEVLLEAFDQMVRQQLQYEGISGGRSARPRRKSA